MTCSYIILFVYLFSLCSTPLYSCSTGERSEEDFVCMEISLVGLLGNAETVELFDAWASVNCWDAVFFFLSVSNTSLRQRERNREEPAG